jgi:hypothetical protein
LINLFCGALGVFMISILGGCAIGLSPLHLLVFFVHRIVIVAIEARIIDIRSVPSVQLPLLSATTCST